MLTRLVMIEEKANPDETLVKEDSPDPMLALAERYLLKASCARIEGIEERFQYLKGLANDSMADGIIYSTVKFCDTYVYDVPIMRTTFEDAGTSFLSLENAYEWTRPRTDEGPGGIRHDALHLNPNISKGPQK